MPAWSYIEKTFYGEKESGRKVCPFLFLLFYPLGTPRADPGPCIISCGINVSPFLLLLCYPSGAPRADPGPCIISYEMNVTPFLFSGTPRAHPGPCIISYEMNVTPFPTSPLLRLGQILANVSLVVG